MTKVIRDRIGMRDDTPLPRPQLARAVMTMDPLCLLHGVFFAADKKTWPGQPKIARAITGFIEAGGVQSAVSGGVKRDAVRHGVEEGGGSKEGYGSIPFHRTEFSARTITAFFSVDLEQFRSYGLGEEATELLDVIARWEIASLLAGGMRLRTACDLEPVESVDVLDRGLGCGLRIPKSLPPGSRNSSAVVRTHSVTASPSRSSGRARRRERCDRDRVPLGALPRDTLDQGG